MIIISNKILFVNDNFYLKGDCKFVKVDGKRISLQDFPNLDLYLHKNKIGFWCVVEGITACRLTKFHKSIAHAMREIKKILKSKTESIVFNKIIKSLKSRSLSPRYRYIVNPTRKLCGIQKR